MFLHAAPHLPLLNTDYHPARLIMHVRPTVAFDPVVSWTKSDPVIKMAKNKPPSVLGCVAEEIPQRTCLHVVDTEQTL